MSQHSNIPLYKTAPFIRLLFPFIAGIIIQWYWQPGQPMMILAVIGAAAANITFHFLPLVLKYKLQGLQGFLINVLLFGFGLLVTSQKDIRQNEYWYGNYYKDAGYIIAKIDEPLIEKARSYKATAIVETFFNDDTNTNCTGKLLLYFFKDSTAPQLQYGDRILLHKDLQPIKKSGNPGAFNYEQYAAFQGIFHNVFLKDKDWVLLPGKKGNAFRQFIFSARQFILDQLRNNISTGKDELGIAEALLIGYTNDLEKDLVQAYSNTGVVHIIAISGMHLGLIYVLLVWVFARMPLIKRSKPVQVILILSCLWLFSLLTGASASVLRSAVMFTCIAIGKDLSKKTSIYNSLAASAFILLCYDPYYLWDVGFVLSYLAIIGIIVFQKPIYNTLYVKNKWLDNVWQLASVSLAAQILTFPICLYYFHQFPNLFLVTNIVAVPLSSIILYAEIFLMFFSWQPFIGTLAGQITGWLVGLMNKIIISVNALPFAVWDNIPANIISTFLLYVIIIFGAAWLINKNKISLRFTLLTVLFFIIANDLDKWQVKNQRKLIVYNVPRCQAIDIAVAGDYKFIGDSVLQQNGMLQNFHLKPARILLQLDRRLDSQAEILSQSPFYQFNDKRVVVIDKPSLFEPGLKKIDVDIIIISKNVKLYIPQLARVFNCNQYVADASNSLWKIAKWKKDCDSLHLQLHSVPAQGAFVFDL